MSLSTPPVPSDDVPYDVLIQAFDDTGLIVGHCRAAFSARLPISPLVQQLRRIPGTVRVLVDIACPEPARPGPLSPACFRGDAVCDDTTLCAICAP